MELVSFAKDVIRNAAEHVASYRIGQAALRHADRALWVVEKCARWAVPPPLDIDDTPQPELVRPLPWVFFLMMLVVLRVTRESISLVNLIRGMPPLRSADVVMYIQSKRRYLRTLKYQGNRNIRARNAPQSEPWYRGLQALFEVTMCFRPARNYGNNNTTRLSNNDEVLVVKRSKRPRDSAGTVATTSDTTMERLIEKMMVQLDADSDDDSSFTLTNATSLRSDRSEDSDPEDTFLENHKNTADSDIIKEPASPVKSDVASTTPDTNNAEKPSENNKNAEKETKEIFQIENNAEKPGENGKEAEKGKKETVQKENGTDKENVPTGKNALSEPNKLQDDSSPENETAKTEPIVNDRKKLKYSPKETTNNFLQSERCSPQKQPSKQSKFANGRAMSVPNKKKGLVNQNRDSDTPVLRISHSDDSL